MPKIEIPHQPDLTPSDLAGALQRQFKGYEVYESALLGIDLVVKKSGWTGAGVRLVQKPGRTFVKLNGMSPSAMARLFLGGLIPFLILWLGPWKKIIAEVREFLETTPKLAPAPSSDPVMDVEVISLQ